MSRRSVPRAVLPVIAVALSVLAASAACSSTTTPATKSASQPSLNADPSLQKNSRYDYDSLVGTLHASRQGERICFWVTGNRQGVNSIEKRLLVVPAGWTSDAAQTLYDESGGKVGKEGDRVRLEGSLQGASTLPACGPAADVFEVVAQF